MTIVLKAAGINKTYGRVNANIDVSLDLCNGEVHAVLGENGAGKSTLMRVLYGLETPDSGHIEVKGSPRRFHAAKDAIEAGIGMVHQHFMLIPTLTVLENLIVGSALAGKVLKLKTTKARIEELANRYRMVVDLDKRACDLSVSEQQRVEILKTLVRGATILILDEPTAVLTPSEIADFMATLQELAARDFSILIVTHKLSEVMQVSGRVTVMRSGRVVGTWITSQTTAADLVMHMIGRNRETTNWRSEGMLAGGRTVLEARNLHVKGDRSPEALRGLDLTVNAGEIVGIAGVEGNGQQELAEVVIGLRSIVAGQIVTNGIAVKGASTTEILRSGVGLVPADRLRDGLVLDFSIAENAVLIRHRESAFHRLGILVRRRMLAFANDLIGEFRIKSTSAEASSRSLSGGNQQKLILGREIMRNPALLIVIQPTRGLDVGAIEYVHMRLRESRNAGMAILLISSDLEEILNLSDRVAVLRDGQIVRSVPRSAATAAGIGRLMLGSSDIE